MSQLGRKHAIDVHAVSTPPARPAHERGDEAAREPMFNAPGVIVALCLGLVALYALQAASHPDVWNQRYGLTRGALAAGRWQTLVTYMFLHGSWPHVVLNTVGLFAFGPLTARLMGRSSRGVLAFLGFYFACGLLAGLGYLLVAPDSIGRDGPIGMVGASGAISGLIGAAARIMEGRGRIGPILGRTVIAVTAAFAVPNVLLAAFGLTPGAYGMPVAWQAHLAGYAAGVLLIGPFARLAGPGEPPFTH